MNYVTENITPERAKAYLCTSNGNRNISRPTVITYAEAMKSGNWLLNGVCIIFDNEGHLIDGHHRLHAVIEAGIPVTFSVCRGAPADAFVTYDCGRHRTIGQILSIRGTKHYNMVGSIVAANEQLIKTGKLIGNNSAISGKTGRGKMTNKERFEQFMKDEKGFSAVAEIIVRLQGRCRIIQASWSGGLYYYLTHTGGYKENEVLPFFEALYSLDSSDIEVVNMLRKVLMTAKMTGNKLVPEKQWAFIVKAWNCYATGKTPKIFKYARSQEEIPELKLKGIL